ncbi:MULTISPECIES: class C sortase [Peptoniphilus]|jgi:sortase family protein|uniref:class C sortase n=1 Tax=Peptoniphilus TaxID=162289 RepID=UPI0002898B4B|nr:MULTISPECIES: class C sortase [Peptoniphilus]MBS6610455.1 class C sortase [Peptoniphilus harei]MDU1043070.1 class C sortase [Peptoniphilus rhinitidis]MDU1954835.1 class C sortase [Peptoniphilus lacydonensis]MDU2110016.1 class C sortase [Peptoniphilus lacydonensis]MDU5274359.1 class C sortase [Peptoniphilus lacydonensis]
MKEKIKKNWKIIVLFVIGLLIAIYPVISNYYYTVENNNQIKDFEEAVQKLPDEEVNERMDLAKAYNETLDPSRLADPYTEREKKGVENYARMIEVREKIGYIDIPKINQKIPVYAGTSEDVLQHACGHLEGTSLPIGGVDTHAVITAHRGLPQVKLFRELDKLEIGDEFYYTNVRETLAYQVDQILVVEPWDFEPVLVVEGKDLMTLLTCTPYMINSHRLLVRGHRVPYIEKKAKEDSVKKGFDYKTLIVPTVISLAIIFTIYYYIRRRRRKYEE